VARMGPDDNSAIGSAIVKLAKELGMGLIAEGVETVAHAERLLALGCPLAQGYLFSEPRTKDSVEALLTMAFGTPGHTRAAASADQNLRSFTRRTA
jgi:EAL domain-containing protein (putative c-di-GMP-specific phosphodiesterase class I)